MKIIQLNSQYMMQPPPTCNTCQFKQTEPFINGMVIHKCSQVLDCNGKSKDISCGIDILPDRVIKKPDWCPFAQVQRQHHNPRQVEFTPTYLRESKETKTAHSMVELTYWEKRERWKKVTPRVKWKDIQVGKTYLIPTLPNHHRRVVKVLNFYNNRLRVQVMSNKDNPYNDFMFLDNYDLEAKYLVELKTLSSPFSSN